MANLPEIFAQITSRAESDGQNAIAEAARHAASPGAPERLLVLAWNRELAPGVRDWLRREAASVLADAVDPAELVREPWSAVLADRIVAVLPCGEFLDADQFEQVQQLVLSRPRDTFRVILGAAQVPDAGTLARSEASLGNLLRPQRMGHPSAGSAVSELLLWVENPSERDLAGRAERDRAALAEWLRRPVAQAARDELAHQRASS